MPIIGRRKPDKPKIHRCNKPYWTLGFLPFGTVWKCWRCGEVWVLGKRRDTGGDDHKFWELDR